MKIVQRQDKFIIVDFSEFEAYRIAGKIEKDGIDFYEKISQETDNRQIQEKLEFLLGEERRHLGFFEDQLFRIRQKKEDTAEDNDLLTSMDFGIFQPYQNIENLSAKLDNAKKTLRLGIVIEDNSIKFYNACLDGVKDNATKKEIKNIIAEERRHKELLEGLIRNIV